MMGNTFGQGMHVAMEADILTEDRDEIVSLMEPLLLGPRHREHLTDLTLDLALKGVGVSRQPARKYSQVACRSGALDELLLLKPHRGPQYPSRRY